MLERLRRAVVESFVGAIALGYLFAQVILHFVGTFASPIQIWITRKELHGLMPGTIASSTAGLSLQDAVPELIRFLFLAVVWYFLMRWLYFRPANNDRSEPQPTQDGTP